MSANDTAGADASSASSIRLSETVYNDLRDDIFAFRLMPGDRFAENDIAERLRVSRTPVREALMRLRSEGLVHGHFRNGWEVVPIDFARFAALYELREMIEVHAVRKLCRPEAANARALLLAELDPVWRPASALRLRDALEVAALDERFHLALVGAAGNPETDTVYRQVTERIRILRRLDFAYGDCLAQTYDEHAAILAALEAGDSVQGAALIADHIEDGHATVKQMSIERLQQIRTKLVAPLPQPAQARRKRFS